MESCSGNIHDIITDANISKIIKSNTIESGLKFAFSTGNWGMKSASSGKQGIAQLLNRITYNSSLSYLRRVNTPIEKSGKLIQPRKLNATQWGVVCPAETPEGASVGVVKNLALCAHITSYSNPDIVYSILDKNGIIKLLDIKAKMIMKKTKIFVNGNWYGVHEDPISLMFILRNERENGIINMYTGITWDYKTNNIYINTEAGRSCRPLFKVRKKKITFNDTIAELLNKDILKWNNLLNQILIHF